MPAQLRHLIQLCILLQYVIRAPESGVIKAVPYKEGDTVPKGAALVQFEETEENQNNTNDQ